MKVYLVFTEDGDYENWSRDFRGAFATERAAETFADELRRLDNPDVCEVVAEAVKHRVPRRGTFHRIEAFVLPDGKIGTGIAARKHESWPCWLHEHPRVVVEREESEPTETDEDYEARFPESTDLHRAVWAIEAQGTDYAAVKAAFARELAAVRVKLRADG